MSTSKKHQPTKLALFTALTTALVITSGCQSLMLPTSPLARYKVKMLNSLKSLRTLISRAKSGSQRLAKTIQETKAVVLSMHGGNKMNALPSN